MIGADAAHQKGDAQVGREHHMRQAHEERRVEDDGEPVFRHEAPVGSDGIAGRRLHPGIGRKDPRGRDERAQGDEESSGEMQTASNLVHAEQHDAQKPGFQEERGQHLIAHQRPDHRPRLVGERRPVGAELVGHDEARHHAHRKADGEYLQPILEQVEIDGSPRPQPQRLQHREVTRQSYRQRGKHDMKNDGEGELRAREMEGV